MQEISDVLKRRKKTHTISVGNVLIGGNAPISVQSMTNTDPHNVYATVGQIKKLAGAGCDIVRVAVPDEATVEAMRKIVRTSPIPIIADIHFNDKLAIKSIEAGVHGIRINPGTIGGKKRFADVLMCAKDYGIAVRIGINAGSLEKDILRAYMHPSAEALVESALRAVEEAERLGCINIKLSLKSSNVLTTIKGYRLLSRKIRYPLHIGITEAGTLISGTVKSAVGLGILLAEGIGDTMRVSLAADPVHEVRVAYEILRCLGLRIRGPEIIACPTCGRKKIDVVRIASAIERRCSHVDVPIKIAVMGCEVNGPGEAKEADIGLAGSLKGGVIFKKGIIVKRCTHDRMLNEFMNEIRAYYQGGHS
ncbi:MAG: flavodoxin-dependent (E)-4-hydroxy-3-methylbut-2-enyl-diphosphate synthase [Desulfobacterota bacterium]|nr:flavodoxin-dependent (E)-4-hydroxy-3-methylbut-2-enyl-diphosphate synthase [Thermodesulfobacteriota bacterium]